MGYQETFLRIKNKKFFPAFVDAINSTGKKYYEEKGFSPVAIYTFLKDHDPFKKGEKSIYFVGDRSCQRCTADLIGCDYGEFCYGDVNEYDFLKDFISEDGVCENIFTEEVEPEGIFEDSGKVTDVEVEDFVFSEKKPFSDAASSLINFVQSYEITPEEELLLVSEDIRETDLYKRYKVFRNYLISKGFKIISVPSYFENVFRGVSIRFKANYSGELDKTEFSQKLKESGFILTDISTPESCKYETNKSIFTFSNPENAYSVNDEEWELIEFSPIENFEKKVQNAYKENPKLSEEQQKIENKSNALIKYLFDNGMCVRSIDITEPKDFFYLSVNISKHLNFEEFKNIIIESGYAIFIENIDDCSDADCYRILPGIRLTFHNNFDGGADDLFENYEETVKKTISLLEAQVNQYLINPSDHHFEKSEKRGCFPPESVYQMNNLCKDLLSLGCAIKEMISIQEDYVSTVRIRCLEKIDFNTLKNILEKYSYYIDKVSEGDIILKSVWDISEYNLYWYCDA